MWDCVREKTSGKRELFYIFLNQKERKTMEISGFNQNDISEQNKEALKSETWKTVRKAMKTEVQHFTEAPEIQHFAIEKVRKNDNVYGVVWGNVVMEYLKTAYSGKNAQADVVSDGITYKVLKREEVTAFYDADGNTLFDVENKRLEKEYEWVMNDSAKADAEITKLEESEADVAVAEEENADMVKEETDKKIGEAPKTGRAEDEKEGSSVDKTERVKSYSSGEEKLIAEEDEMIASVKPEFKKIMQAQMDLIFKELISWTKQDPEFEKKVLLNYKSMKRCMKFCADKAMGLREPSEQEKAAARNNNIPIMTPVGSDMLFEWIKEYYDKDDKAEVEKEKKEAAVQKKYADKKKTVGKKKSSSKRNCFKKAGEKTVEKKEDTKAAGSPKKRDKVVNGQISMFDFLGV